MSIEWEAIQVVLLAEVCRSANGNCQAVIAGMYLSLCACQNVLEKVYRLPYSKIITNHFIQDQKVQNSSNRYFYKCNYCSMSVEGRDDKPLKHILDQNTCPMALDHAHTEVRNYLATKNGNQALLLPPIMDADSSSSPSATQPWQMNFKGLKMRCWNREARKKVLAKSQIFSREILLIGMSWRRLIKESHLQELTPKYFCPLHYIQAVLRDVADDIVVSFHMWARADKLLHICVIWKKFEITLVHGQSRVGYEDDDESVGEQEESDEDSDLAYNEVGDDELMHAIEEVALANEYRYQDEDIDDDVEDTFMPSSPTKSSLTKRCCM
ncbi:hypothetical protein EDD22DRAFT_856161 [Suillus occidentalis]|nr:hypothetical protein EDD22DRAFT_856161 [Suillus occidentalis]